MKLRTKMALATFAAALLAGAIGSVALAQSTPVTRFDNGYLDEHPEVARQRRRIPRWSITHNSWRIIPACATILRATRLSERISSNIRIALWRAKTEWIADSIRIRLSRTRTATSIGIQSLPGSSIKPRG